MTETEKIVKRFSRNIKTGLAAVIILATIDNLHEATSFQIQKAIDISHPGILSLYFISYQRIIWRLRNELKLIRSFVKTLENSRSRRQYHTLTPLGKEVIEALKSTFPTLLSN